MGVGSSLMERAGAIIDLRSCDSGSKHGSSGGGGNDLS